MALNTAHTNRFSFTGFLDPKELCCVETAAPSTSSMQATPRPGPGIPKWSHALVQACLLMRRDKEAADLLCPLLGVLWILLQIYSIRNLSVVQYFRQIRFKEKKQTSKQTTKNRGRLSLVWQQNAFSKLTTMHFSL